ncbi:tectonin beta-propeller repeat-containing protein 2-like isoform X2 [Octopus sinensis]|uniref:Tectonin beta-propeller repeat-containing protein 2-like isoform X1 n=1 Tax=Octopus sinensis TaxID=2607531 RepID=A0A6P7SVM9_9MOLL|nr:tectonin beta-propeller repeat-containing protein 2-like isoform X1 [Octopus sinensis]XP_029642299.1 tectonin beta-propeller repeat-containing protein 2-like isoform X3 [Octopus sinensis]XP_036362994.1 tectonin beta-propeller repeat-containing protein 2-like isoform X2 [Octopus sinensis]
MASHSKDGSHPAGTGAVCDSMDRLGDVWQPLAMDDQGGSSQEKCWTTTATATIPIPTRTIAISPSSTATGSMEGQSTDHHYNLHHNYPLTSVQMSSSPPLSSSPPSLSSSSSSSLLYQSRCRSASSSSVGTVAAASSYPYSHAAHSGGSSIGLTRTTTTTSVASTLLYENPELREHEPMTGLLGLIPSKALKGMFNECELLLTCIAASGEYICLGTNVGLVFMFNRKKRCLERLRCEKNDELVTCVKIQHGIDYQVAAGTSMGGLYMFNIPSDLVANRKLPQRFSVQDVHSTPLTCLEWSPNGMKLFSGDKKGVVVCTEVDFQKGRCQSSVLLTEFLSEIVQLSYFQRALLVSTSMRALICRTDRDNEIIQVGQKKRKIPGNYGACFIPMLCKLADAQLYAGRPGQRVWMSNIDGVVQATHIFKHLTTDCREIPLLHYDHYHSTDNLAVTDQQFGHLCPYGDSRQIVTWNKKALFLLDPEKNVVIGKQDQFGHIIDVAINSKEIFVLTRTSSRQVIRISPQPECQRYKVGLTVNITAANASKNEDEYRNRSNSPIHFLPANIFGIIRPKESKYSPSAYSRKSSEPKSSEFQLPKEARSRTRSLSSQDDLNRSSDSNSSQRTSLDFAKSMFQPIEKRGKSDTSKESVSKSPRTVLPPLITLPSDDIIQLELFSQAIDNDSGYDPHTANEEICTGIAATELIGADAMSEDKGGSAAEPVSHSERKNSKMLVRRSFVDRIDMSNYDDNEIVFKSKTKKKKHGSGIKSKKRFSCIETTSQLSDTCSVDSLEISATPNSVCDNIKASSSNLQHKTLTNNSFEPSLNLSDQLVLTATSPGSCQSLSSTDNSSATSPENPENFTDSDENLIPPSLPVITCCRSVEKETDETLMKFKETKVVKSEPIRTDIASDNTSLKAELNNSSAEKTQSLPRNTVQIDNDEGNKGIQENTTKIFVQDLSSSSDSSPLGETPVSSSTGSNKLSEDRKTAAPLSRRNEPIKSASSPQLSSENTSESEQPECNNSLHVCTVADKALSPLEKIVDSTGNMTLENGENVSYYTESNDANETARYDFDSPNHCPRPANLSTDVNPSPQQLTHETSSKPPFHRSESADSTTEEDFYRMYRSSSSVSFLESPLQPSNNGVTHLSSSDNKSSSAFTNSKNLSKLQEQEKDRKNEVLPKQILLPKLVNSWLVWSVPENIHSLSATHSHIWYTDRSENLFYRQTDSMSGAWHKVDLYAHQIAVSRSGNIFWRLYQNTVYVAIGVSARKPEGKKQVEAIRDVSYIAVDNDCGWYIKVNGEIAVHKKLSRERPAYRSQKIPCEYNLIQLACLNQVIWGLTKEGQLVCRAGVSDQHPEGDEWCKYEGPSNWHVPEMMNIALGDNNIGWCVDTQGRVWFCTNVTREHPFGQGMWYQVAFSDYFMMDPTMTDMMRSVAERLDPQKLSQLLISPRGGGLIAATHVGTWFVPSYRNVIQVCKSIMQGHHWTITPPLGMAISSSWRLVSAGAYTEEHEYIWAQHVNGEMVIFSPEARHFKMVSQPSITNHFICISASEDSLWGLATNGTIYVRSAVRSSCPEGINWVRLDLEQLGNNFFTHLSCGSDCIWAVDNKGSVYHKFGVHPPSHTVFTPVWLQVDPEPNGICFTQVIAGPENWMVWAIDNRKQVYMRDGISDKMSIGTKWCQITGTPANQLSISKLTVWALNPEGEILHRLGVSIANRGGDYWKKIPGVFSFLSASPSNELWAISKELQLYRHHTKFIYRKRQSAMPAAPADLLDQSTMEDDWEIV